MQIIRVDVPEKLTGALDKFPIIFPVNRISVILFLISQSVSFRWLTEERTIYEVPFQEFCSRCRTWFQTCDFTLAIMQIQVG
jgi:hypothetical protein